MLTSAVETAEVVVLPAIFNPRNGSLASFKLLETKKPREGHYYHLVSFVSWAARKKAAKRTAQVAYGCNFVDGRCKGNPRTDKHASDQACCKGCKSAMGYLDEIPVGTALQVFKLFDKVLGFWRPGKGCILPRELRSNTCLVYHCRDGETSSSHVIQQLIQIGFLTNAS